MPQLFSALRVLGRHTVMKSALTVRTEGLSLGREETILARIITGAAIVGAMTTVASVVAAWYSLLAGS